MCTYTKKSNFAYYKVHNIWKEFKIISNRNFYFKTTVSNIILNFGYKYNFFCRYRKVGI